MTKSTGARAARAAYMTERITKMYKTMLACDIAKELGVCPTTVSYYARKLRLEHGARIKERLRKKNIANLPKHPRRNHGETVVSKTDERVFAKKNKKIDRSAMRSISILLQLGGDEGTDDYKLPTVPLSVRKAISQFCTRYNYKRTSDPYVILRTQNSIHARGRKFNEDSMTSSYGVEIHNAMTIKKSKLKKLLCYE